MLDLILSSLFSNPLLYLILILSYPLITLLRNPVSRIPAAHPLARFTSLWIASIRYRGIENATLKEAHARLGPIVCLSPNEVSVNCVVGGIREVYGGGFEKGDPKTGYNWYSFFTNYDGVYNMFSTPSNKPHSTRKRILSNIYSKSVITSSGPLLSQTSSILYNRFLPSLESHFSPKNPGTIPGSVNIYALLSATTMDIVTAYIFGLSSSSNLIDNPDELYHFLDLYHSRHGYNFWPQEYPKLTEFVKKWTGYRFAPPWVDTANAEIEKWTMSMCNRAISILAQQSNFGDEEIRTEDTPVVFHQLWTGLEKEIKRGENGDYRYNQTFYHLQDLVPALASEVLDHLAAGFDTSSITLVYAIHELSRHPGIQEKLRAELRTLSPPLTASSAPELPSPKSIDALPFLHAVLWETLRLHSAIPGPQPRFTPAQGCHLGPNKEYHVPGGVRVSASAGLLHRNEDVYEMAEEWRPERWIEDVDVEKRKDMESRWFWAFGSGGRMCVGSHLAVYQMKYILAALYTTYTTTIIDDAGIEQTDAYTAPPKSDKLIIKLNRASDVGAT